MFYGRHLISGLLLPEKERKRTQHFGDYIYNVVYFIVFVISYDNLQYVYNINLLCVVWFHLV